MWVISFSFVYTILLYNNSHGITSLSNPMFSKTLYSGLSMYMLHAGDKSSVQRGFSQIAWAIYSLL